MGRIGSSSSGGRGEPPKGTLIEYVPMLALVSYVLVPRWLFGTGILADIGPAPVLLALWSSVVLLSSRPGAVWFNSSIRTRRVSGFLMLALFGWILISRYESVYRPTVWVVAFACTLLLPTLATASVRERMLVLRGWLVLGGLLGVLLVMEQVTSSAPFYSSLRATEGAVAVQRWSVYRSFGPFEHPLYAAVFMSVAAVIGLGYWLAAGSRWAMLAGLLSSLGLISTVSRGAMLATVVGLVAVVILVQRGAESRSQTRTMLLVGAMMAAALVVPTIALVSERANSAEAASSVRARVRLLEVASDLAGMAGPLGAGPGTSSRYAERYTSLVLESSWLQVWVSLGLVGLLLFVLAMTSVVMMSVLRRDAVLAGAVLTFLTAISAFNAIDDAPGLLAILGLLIVMASAADPSTASKRGGGFRFTTSVGQTAS